MKFFRRNSSAPAIIFAKKSTESKYAIERQASITLLIGLVHVTLDSWRWGWRVVFSIMVSATCRLAIKDCGVIRIKHVNVVLRVVVCRSEGSCSFFENIDCKIK